MGRALVLERGWEGERGGSALNHERCGCCDWVLATDDADLRGRLRTKAGAIQWPRLVFESGKQEGRKGFEPPRRQEGSSSRQWQ